MAAASQEATAVTDQSLAAGANVVEAGKACASSVISSIEERFAAPPAAKELVGTLQGAAVTLPGVTTLAARCESNVAGKALLDLGGEVAAEVVTIKKLAHDAAMADKDLTLRQIPAALAIYQEAERQLRTPGLKAPEGEVVFPGDLADSYSKRVVVYKQVEELLREHVTVPAMTQAERDALNIMLIKGTYAEARAKLTKTFDLRGVRHQGLLLKRGPTVAYMWVERWCVLYSGALQYFSDATMKELKGTIDIYPGMTRAVAIRKSEAPGDAVKHRTDHPNGFVVDAEPSAGKGRHLYYFDALCQQTLQQWLDAIDQASSHPAPEPTKKAKMVGFSAEEMEREPQPSQLQRKNTCFINAAQVRQLATGQYDHSDEESSEGEDQNDEEFEKQVHANLAKNQRGSRAAICSEAVQLDPDWEPPVNEKTREQQTRLSAAVSESFMFAALSQHQLRRVIDAFQEIRAEPGAIVINQGDAVGATEPAFFVLDTGKLDVFKNGAEAAVFTYTERGQYFGNLALLYNAPRAATVKAVDSSVLWAIDRDTFNSLVKDGIRKQTEKRLEFLKSVDLLNDLSPEEVATIADSLRERQYGDGVHIITAGEVGQEFFILEQGKAVAKKDGEVVCEYNPASYFGELALLQDAPRAADVVTQSKSTVLILDRSAFNRLLGPLEKLKENKGNKG